MGTSVFDSAWGDDPKPKRKLGQKAPAPDSFEALWEENFVPKESLRFDVRQPSESTGALPYNRANRSGDFQALEGAPSGLVEPLAASALTAAQVVPGAERFEALMGSAGSQFTDKPLSYGESLGALRSQTDAIPTPIKMALQAPGMLKTAAGLALSPAKAGMAIGAADQALSADEMSPGDRAFRTLAGGAAGAGFGRVADVAQSGARVLGAKNTAKVLGTMEDARAASAAPLYSRATAEGHAAMANVGASQGPAAVSAFSTPKVEALFQRPEVLEIARGLKQLDEFAAVPIESPEMLDGIYKVLSDRTGQLGRRLDAVTPNRPNLGRFDKTQVQSVQKAILDASDQPMPSYRSAVQDFAEKSGEMRAVERGHDAVRSRLNRNLPMAKSLKKTSPKSFEDYITNSRRTAAERAGAESGILGGTRRAFGQSVKRSGIPALLETADLLRAARSGRQQMSDRALRALLLGSAAAVP